MGQAVFQEGSTTLTLNGFAVTDFANGDIITLTPVNEHSAHQYGTGGSVVMNRRADSRVHDLTFRVLAGSDSDIRMNLEMNQENLVVFNGSIKADFINDAGTLTESYILESGSFTTQPTRTINNVDGNHVIEYTIRFTRAFRNI